MYNDGRYHFFGLDFNGSHSAVHGQHVIAQATFLNDALRAIQDVDPPHYDGFTLSACFSDVICCLLIAASRLCRHPGGGAQHGRHRRADRHGAGQSPRLRRQQPYFAQ